ncbi:MAG: TlpA family protein disulfide reductase [Chloroflexi bacterium]|nr:TlpA family protein disulfide reductase [Chloroflexota bacterium]
MANGGADEQPRPRGRRAIVQVSVARAVLAAVLLAGLFALLFFVLLPGGGEEGSAEAARLVDTPPGSTEASVGVRPGDLARDFTASNLEGVRFRLSELRGRPVVINFWATWCVSCLTEMPVLEEQRQTHLAEGLTIVAVNAGEGLSEARGFIDALELYGLGIAMDPDLTISDAYGVRGLPLSVFIDRDGVIQAMYRGQLDDETMDAYVQAAIDAVPGGEPPDTIRFVEPVRRIHVLEVFPDEEAPNRVLFVSRRFRCDDGYCATPVADGLRATAGVTDVELRSDEAAPALAATFDPDVIDLEAVVAIVAEALRAHPDSLYTRELQVSYPETSQ